MQSRIRECGGRRAGGPPKSGLASGLFCLAEAAADGCVVAAEVVGDFVQGVAPVAVGGGDRVAGGGKEGAERRPERLPVGAWDLGRPLEVGGLVADELLAAEEDALDVWLGSLSGFST